MKKKEYNQDREMELSRGYRALTLKNSEGRLGYATKEEQDMIFFLNIFHPEISEERKGKILKARRSKEAL